jgi:hypothetical protein
MPFTRIPSGRLRRLAAPVLVAYLPAWLPFLLVGEPNEMVRLQFAGSEARAQQILAGWSHAETVDMALLLGIDHVHLVAYGVLLALAAVWAGRQFRGSAARWAPVVAWMALAAAVFDIGENIGMIVMIRGQIDAPVPTTTTAFSLAKYSVAVVVVSYVVAGFVARLAVRRARQG